MSITIRDIKFLFKFCLFIASPIIAVIVFFALNYIGWMKIGIMFSILIGCSIVFIFLSNQKSKPTEADKYHNARMEKLRQELSRPIIQARLAKQKREVADFGTIATGKAAFTDKNGKTQDLDIHINLKLK